MLKNLISLHSNFYFFFNFLFCFIFIFNFFGEYAILVKLSSYQERK